MVYQLERHFYAIKHGERPRPPGKWNDTARKWNKVCGLVPPLHRVMYWKKYKIFLKKGVDIPHNVW